MGKNKTVADGVQELIRFYARRLSDAQMIFYEQAFEDCDEDMFCRAIMRVKESEPVHKIPTPETIRKYYQAERDRVWHQRKQGEPGATKIVRLYNTGERYQKFKALIDALGKVSKDEWLRQGVESGLMTPTDAENLKADWQRMGADQNNWSRGGLFDD